jgi:hypothetical protein
MIVKYLVVIMARCVRDRVKGAMPSRHSHHLKNSKTRNQPRNIAMSNDIAFNFSCQFGRDEQKESFHSEEAEHRARTRPDLSLNLEFTPPGAPHLPNFVSRENRPRHHHQFQLTSSTPIHTLQSPNTYATMKLLTLNFLTCAIKTCKTNPASFPLHPRDAELEIQEAELNLAFLKNILPRLMWDEIRVIASEVRYIYILPYISTNPQHVAANKHVESLLI